MKELVEVIAKSLVDYPDEVNVTETENEKAIVLELRVAQSDMGKVIGKQGRIAKANTYFLTFLFLFKDLHLFLQILRLTLILFYPLL